MLMNQQIMPPNQIQLVPIHRPASQWSSGIFDCDLNMGPFCMACFFPSIQYGTNMSIINKSGCLLPAGAYLLGGSLHLHCFLGALSREKIRERYHIKGDLFQDALLHYFCIPCVLAQEHREIIKREHADLAHQPMLPHLPIPRQYQQQIPQPGYIPMPNAIQPVYIPMPQNQVGHEWDPVAQNLSFMCQAGLPTIHQPTEFAVMPPHDVQSLQTHEIQSTICLPQMQHPDYMAGQKMDNRQEELP